MTKQIGIIISCILLAFAGHFIAFKLLHPPQQLEFVILLTIALFYPVIRYPMFGLYCVFLLLPFVPFIRRSYYLLYSRPIIDPLIAIGYIIIALILIALFFELRERRGIENRMKMIRNLITVYFVYLLIRTFMLNTLSVQDAILRFGFYGPPVVLFFIGMYYAPKINHLKFIWIITICIGTLSAIYGFKQLYFGYSQAEKIWFASISFTTLFIKGIARPFSFFQSPASFADYMQISLIAIIVLYAWGKSAGKHLLLLLIPVLFYGSLITSVRSNWVGIMLSVLLWMTIIRVKGPWKRFGILAAFLTIYGLYTFFDASSQTGVESTRLLNATATGKFSDSYIDLLVTERAGAISNPFEEHSFISRVALWKYILSSSLNPEIAIFGSGLGTMNADSLYFTYLGEFGYPGLIFIIYVVIYFIATGFKLIDKSKERNVIAIAKGVTIMNIAFAIINITGTHIHSFPGDSYFWFWNGVLSGLLPLCENSTQEPAGGDADINNSGLPA